MQLIQVEKILNGGGINLEIGWHEERALAHEGIQKNHLELDDALIQRTPLKMLDIEKIQKGWVEKRKNSRNYRDSDEDKELPFAETVAKILNDNLDEISRNFILTGAPSAGKTTELNVIAGELIKQWAEDTRKVIHFCSIQNTSISHAKINSKQELWNLIMESHSSKYWARKNLQIPDFLKWHKNHDIEPILFVDTIDLLTYGSNQIGSKTEGKIAEYWNSIMEELDSEENVKPTIVWSSRTVEWGKLKKEIKNQDLVKEIKLVPINPDELMRKGLVQRIPKETRDEQNNYFLRHIQQAFPILAGYAIRGLLHENTIEELNRILKKVENNEDIRPYERQSPIPWIMAAVDREFATDVLYRCLVSSLCEKVERRFEKRYTHEEIKEIWEDFVEDEFFEAALPRHNVGRRIQVQFDLSDFEEPHVKDIVNELLFISIRTGILKKNENDVFEMGHQLFAEYCVYKIGMNESNKNNLEIQDKLRGFPSIWLRLFDEQDPQILDDNEDLKARLKEAKEWLYPFAVFNKALPVFKEETNLPQEWEDLIELATYYSGKDGAGTEMPEYPVDSFHWLNDEKTKLLNSNLYSKRPLLINGPPGVGKSHISFIWADQRAFKNAGVSWAPINISGGKDNHYIRERVRDKNPVKAMFMTLNRNLIEQQDKRIKQYYQGSINPLNWQTIDIETYLHDMCQVIGIRWKKLEYSKFEEAFDENRIRQRNNGLLNEVRKKSIPALWLEYQVNFIDADGLKKDASKYREGRSSLFTDEQKDVMEEFAKYCHSEFSGDLSIPEIAGKISNKIIKIENSDSRRNKERILTMKSDILVLDEVQDLTSPMISLLLLMHKGDLGSILMCGDDEQTLLYSPFDWKSTFQKINTFFHQMFDQYPSYWQLERLLEPDWKVAASTELNNLIEVERNVEPIVEFIADSWNTSIAKFVQPKESPKRGAGAVKAGKKAIKKGNELDKTGQFYGVYRREINSKELVELCKEIYESTQDAAVIFPDRSLRDHFYDKLDEKGIELPLYTTSDVKGLEYPLVIPVSPWSMNREEINSHLPSNADMTTLNEIESYLDSAKSNEDRQEIIKNIAKQRKRFANIIISRAENLLVILDLDDELLSEEYKILNFNTPVSFPKKEEMQAHFSAWIGDRNERLDNQKREPSREPIKLRSADSLIYRLCTMIDSANQQGNRKQISMQARHIVKALSTQLESEEKFSQSEIKNFTLPFVLIGGLINIDSNESKIKYLLKQINLHMGEKNSIQDWIKSKQKESRMVSTEHEYLQLPFEVYETFQLNLFNQLTRLFKPEEQCFSEENRSQIISAQSTIQWFLQEVFLENLTDAKDGPREWILTFEKLDLQEFSILLPLSKNNEDKLRVMNPDFSSFDLLIPHKENQKRGHETTLKSEVEESTENKDEGRSRFWKKGIKLLNQPINDYDSKEKTGFSHEEGKDILKKIIRDSKALPNSNTKFIQFFHKLSIKVLDNTVEMMQVLEKAKGVDKDEMRKLNKDIETTLKGYLKFDGLGDNKSLSLKPKSYERIAKVLLLDPILFVKILSNNPLDLFHKIDEAEIFESPFILESQLTMYRLLKILKFEQDQKRLLIENEFNEDNFIAKYVLNLISKLVSKGGPGQERFSVETYFSRQIFKEFTTKPGMTSANVFEAKGRPMLFANVFSIFGKLQGPDKIKFNFIRERIFDALDISQIQEMIFTFYKNIFANFQDKDFQYNEKGNVRIETMRFNFDQLRLELKQLNLGQKEDSFGVLKSNENIFSKDMLFKILNIPKFSSNAGDIMFQRTMDNDEGEAWLSYCEVTGISMLLGSHKDNYGTYSLKKDVENEIMRIKQKSFHFDRIYLVNKDSEKSTKLRRAHIIKNISNVAWRKMTSDESKGDKQGWGLKSMDISSFNSGEFNLQSLVLVYDKLNMIREDWLKGIAGFEKNPEASLNQSSPNQTIDRNTATELEEAWMSPDLSRLMDKLNDEMKREQIIKSLKLIVNEMTEPRFFLSMIISNFSNYTKTRKGATAWSTLSNHFFSDLGGSNPKWFASLSSQLKKGITYYTFKKCVLEQCSNKYIAEESDILRIEMITYDNIRPNRKKVFVQQKMIELLQSYGATSLSHSFSLSKLDLNSVKVNWDNSVKSVEKSRRLLDEIDKLPDLNSKIGVRNE